MSSASDYLENKILDHCLGVASFTHAADVYIELYTVAPTDAGGGTPVSGGSYARVIAPFDAASGGVSQNTALITFPTATAAWGTIVAFGIFDASTAGNLHYWSTVTSKVIGDTDTATIAAGAIVVTQT